VTICDVDVCESLLVARALTHFRFRVAFGDEPRADDRRHLTDVALREYVEPDAVDLCFSRRCFDPDFHLTENRANVVPI